MTSVDIGLTRLRTAAGRVFEGYGRVDRFLKRFFKTLLPKGLYARALLIIIAPMVILQVFITFDFMERHWNMVTRRLSAAVVQDIAAVIDMRKGFPQDRDDAELRRIARDRLEIRIQLQDVVMRTFARRDAAYASNSGIFLLWMGGTSLVLIAVAILFLRNQIRPILRLTEAVESFGKGRDAPYLRARGAQEVRRAAVAFLEMKARVERTIEQRTTMLAGVSHDLRTVLTRFKLELAMLDESPETEAMTKDADEMTRMLEGYLAFARGDAGERSEPIDMAAFLDELKTDAERQGRWAEVQFHGFPVATVRPHAFRRCLANLVSNAARFGSAITITGHRDHRYMTVTVDDDGPGIPPNRRDEVFKPFLRLDDARNQDEAGSGLGLAIARDIARSHGGDVMLADSPMGGLRASVRIPV